MDPAGIIVIAVLVLFFGWMAYQRQAAGRARGRTVETLTERFPKLAEPEPTLIFFHNPTCPPCRRMEPTIRELAEETGRVFSVDLSREPALAQSLGIHATPTTFVVSGGRVQKVIVGAAKERKLRKMLQPST